MNNEQRMKNLSVPSGKIDVVLDTDAYNEIDDQFAISYMIKSKEKIHVKAICAAPFYNAHSESPKDGMEKSYDEVLKLLSLMRENVDVFKGSEKYLDDEKKPIISDASKMLAELSNEYSPENPLYVVAIGAITNVASALLLNPEMKNNVVVVWLGGHAQHFHDTKEFNMKQDIAAAQGGHGQHGVGAAIHQAQLAVHTVATEAAVDAHPHLVAIALLVAHCIMIFADI